MRTDARTGRHYEGNSPFSQVLIAPKRYVQSGTRDDGNLTGIGQSKCAGTRAETRFRLSAKRTSPFKSAGRVSSVDCWQPRCAHQR